MTINLNKAIDAKTSNLKHHFIGIKLLGIADLWMLLKVAFDSELHNALGLHETPFPDKFEADLSSATAS